MHELSIAQSLVELLLEQRPGGTRIVRADVEVGALSGVVMAALASAFEPATRGTALEGAALRLHDVAVVGWCEGCGGERAVQSVQRMRCVDCDRPITRITRGRELQVISIEVVDEAENA
jgi:hydrogenase nickel incorporation protein HypA/HybF